MKSSKPIIHGTDHLPGHADPVPLELAGYIRFNHDNLELPLRWLDITTNDADPDGFGIHLHDASGGTFALSSTGGINVTDNSSTGLAVFQAGAGGINISDLGDGGVLLAETGNGGLIVENDGSGQLYVVQTGSGGIKIEETAGNGGVTVRANGTNPLQLDQNGSGGVQLVNNGTGTLQIRQYGTGGLELVNLVHGMVLIAQDGILIDSVGGGVSARIGSSSNFDVLDQTPTLRFRVDNTGRIYMPNLPSSSGTTSELYRDTNGFVKCV